MNGPCDSGQSSDLWLRHGGLVLSRGQGLSPDSGSQLGLHELSGSGFVEVDSSSKATLVGVVAGFEARLALIESSGSSGGQSIGATGEFSL